MRFFKKSGKNLISLDCPYCGYSQDEASGALSTNCKECHAYYKISKGIGVKSDEPTLPKFMTTDEGFESVEPEKKDVSVGVKVYQGDLSFDSKEEEGDEKPVIRYQEPNLEFDTEEKPSQTSYKVKTRKSDTSFEEEVSSKNVNLDVSNGDETSEERSVYVAKKDANKYSKYTGLEEKKTVVCYECDKSHEVVHHASSSLCPSCGTYISLKDHTINLNWNTSIKTRGDVKILKKGVFKNLSVHCHDLTIEGVFDASVDCSNDFIVKRDSEISGKIKCKRLIIEKKIKVKMSSTIDAQEVVIDGTLIANLKCSGEVILNKRGKLIGDVNTTYLNVQKGGEVLGKLKIK